MTGTMRRLAAALAGLVALAGVAQASAFTPLVEAPALAGLLGMSEARVLDLRSPEQYAAGHLPGAVNAPYATWRGPAENPGRPLDDAALTERLQSAGVDFETPVVLVYDGETHSQFGAAARVYWTLKAAGQPTISILNGGQRAWEAAGLPIRKEAFAAERSDVTASLSPALTASREDVRAATEGGGEAVLVDARPEAFFRGEVSHDAAAAAGTLPGAVSFVFQRWFKRASPRFDADVDALARARALADAADGRTIVSFCNTGHWAAINWFALSEVAGVDDVKLYPESVVGWTRAGLPVAPGG